MIYYEDLLGVPYKRFGRGMDGMDCYGFVIECCRRAGKELNDAAYIDEKVKKDELERYAGEVNVKRLASAKEGCIVQCEYKGLLHIGFMADRQTVLHSTYEGVRLTPILYMKNPVYFEVT